MMGSQGVAFVRGRLAAAARLSGVLALHPAELRRGTPPAHLGSWQVLIAGVRAAMGDDAFDAAARAGSALSWDAAHDEAMTIAGTRSPRPATFLEADHDLIGTGSPNSPNGNSRCCG